MQQDRGNTAGCKVFVFNDLRKWVVHKSLHALQAGLLVAETEFALQVESDIAPYKGLLMGLFFMTVGMEISVGLFFAEWKTIVSGIVMLIVGKVTPCDISS